MKIELLTDIHYMLGEGPLWDVDEQRFYWLDCHHDTIYRSTANGTELESWKTPTTIGSMALRKGGGAVVSLRNGLHFFDFKTGKAEPVGPNPEEGMENIRLNDGKVDQRGRFLVGSYDENMFSPNPSTAPRGSLYRLDTDLKLTKLESGIGVSNGPCWSPDGRVFYFADTFANVVWAYDYDIATGTPSNKRDFVCGSGGGMPDGATVDSEGYFWNAWNGAGSGGGDVRRYAPDGTLDRRLQLPSHKVTSLAFGGPNLDILYVTTMNLPGFPEDRREDGYTFKISGLGYTGVPEPRFGG
jgi:sugar lactone lactonase YvrE